MKRLVALLLTILMLGLMCVPALAEDDVTDRNLIGDGATTVKIAFDGESFSREALTKVCQAFFDKTGISVELMFVPSTGSWPREI